MTIVRVRFTPNGVPTPGRVQFTPRHDKDNRALVSGRDIIEGTPEWVEVPHEGAEIDVRTQDAGWHYRVRTEPLGGPSRSGTYLIPATGPVDFQDLVRYDPKAGMAYEPDPEWWSHLVAVETGVDERQAEIQEARDTSVAAAAAALTSRNAASSFATTAQAARDETVALGITVDTTAGTKISVGSTVIHYESGARNAPGAIPTGWTGTFTISRRGNIVNARVDATLNVGSDSSFSTFAIVPLGFRPRIDSGVGSRPLLHLVQSGDPGTPYRTFFAAAGAEWKVGTTSGLGRVAGDVFWSTGDAFPTSLPGTAA